MHMGTRYTRYVAMGANRIEVMAGFIVGGAVQKRAVVRAAEKTR